MSKYHILSGVFIIALALGICSTQAAGSDRVVAGGEGFEVSSSFVRGIGDYYQDRGFTSTEEELLRVAVRVRTFVQDALVTGLIDEIPSDDPSPENIAYFMHVNNVYILRSMLDHPVDPLAVESYYLSYPEKFLKEEHDIFGNMIDFRFRQPLNQDHLMELDQDLQKRIHVQIVEHNRLDFISELFDDLKEKYQVEIL